MARNRKYQAGSVRFVPAIKAILLCVFLGGSAVGYVLQKNQIYELGRQIRDREVALERLTWENHLRANQLADLQSPTKLAERIKQYRLDLIMPQPAQIIWLRETPLELTTNPMSNSVVQ
jgi:hypothetical protein